MRILNKSEYDKMKKKHAEILYLFNDLKHFKIHFRGIYIYFTHIQIQKNHILFLKYNKIIVATMDMFLYHFEISERQKILIELVE